ncbi:MAG: glycosyltransferase [Bacteroidetes bacterium]|nr:glycosyltransferase [Bacteroidota bacterium]
MDKIHVVFFPAWYPHRSDPMPGLFIKRHALSVLPYVRVSVLQVVGEVRKAGPLIEFDYQEEDGIPTQRVYYRKHEGKLGKLLDMYHYMYGTLKGYSMLIARQGPADLNHIHVLTRSGFLPWLIRISGGAPYLITEHWSRYQVKNRHKFKGGFRKWLTRQTVKKAFAVCPVNSQLGEAMQEMGFLNSRYQAISNVVDILQFTVKPEPPPNNRFLHVTCFDEAAKNTKGLLRAFSEARLKRPDLFLTLVGDGPDFEEVKAYAMELGLAAHTDFTGLLEGEDLVRVFHENACLLMFSNYENQPVVILEAFSCGVPVIATKVGGIPDLLSDERGVLIQPGDEAAMTQAILAQADGKNHPKPELLRKYIEDHHSYDTVGRTYFQLYQEALA